MIKTIIKCFMSSILYTGGGIILENTLGEMTPAFYAFYGLSFGSISTVIIWGTAND